MAPRPRAFLLSHGSFNPVHRHHLEMMVQARRVLETAGFEVVRGFLAITPGRRLVQKGAEAVTDKHRLAALQLGCDSVPGPRGWLVPEPRGVNFGSGAALVNGLRPELQQEVPGAILFKVVGADTALRYRGERKGHVVIVCREGSTEGLRKEIGYAGSKGELFLVEELSGKECSSTKLRGALRAGDSRAVGAMCPEAVAEYLLAHREELYEEEEGEETQVPAVASVEKGGEPCMPAGASVEKGGKRERRDKGYGKLFGSKGKGRGAAESEASDDRPALPARPSSSSNGQLGPDELQAPIAARRRWGQRAKPVAPPHAETVAPPLVIGVTGSTRSGKTTLSKRLAQALGANTCVVVCQDSFHRPARNAAEDSWVEVGGAWLRDWETPNQTAWATFESALEQAVASSRIVVAEGFCLLHSERICQMLHGAVWVEIDEPTCWQRRREYPKGWDRAAYFSQCIWPAHRRYQASVFGGEAVLGQAGVSAAFAGRVLSLCGTEPPDALCAQVLEATQMWAAAGAVAGQWPEEEREAGVKQSHPCA